MLLVVHPELGEDAPVFGSASVYGALPGTPAGIGRELLRRRAGLSWEWGLLGSLAVAPPQWQVAHR